MPTTALGVVRNLTLSPVLSHFNLARAWRDTVRHGLRDQELSDLHDHMDIHRRIGKIVSRIHSEVVNGSYRPREPEFVRVEKNIGISRRVVIPSARDAILLQAIVESIQHVILSAQPSPSAFYSRSHSPPSIFNIDHTFPYPWWELWPEFQERIWQFSNDYPFVVMTDVANYFDVLPLQILRNRLTSLGKFQEALVDFLFFMLENFIWRPDYIPSPGVGLPQIQFDAPRLLAHCYLFDADRYLHRTTGGDFVRWMDDINFGARSRSAAKRQLREFDEILATLGLRLNAGKTKILAAQEVVQHLWMQENRQLTVSGNLIRSAQQGNRSVKLYKQYVRRRFKAFWKADRDGGWSKVLKRYFTTYRLLSDPSLQQFVPEMLNDVPEVRKSIYRYYQTLGYSPDRFRQLDRFIVGKHCLDDAGSFGAAKMIVEWSIPRLSPYRNRAVEIANELIKARGTQISAVAAGLWLVCKYSTSSEVCSFVWRTEEVWSQSAWAARQVAASLPRLTVRERSEIQRIIRQYDLADALEVIVHLEECSALVSVDQQMKDYLSYRSEPYPLPKVLIALQLKSGSLDAGSDAWLGRTIDNTVRDPVYRELLT